MDTNANKVPFNADKRPIEADVTQILNRAVGGDKSAADELLPLVYSQLRAVAANRMANENPGHSLQATALVHEAYLKLVGPRKISWQSQAHFFRAAAEAMRQILVDHARTKKRQKRGGNANKMPLNVADLAKLDNSEQILALDDALCRLSDENEEAADIVRLRFFAGLSVDETAASLDIAPRTVDRRWQFARAWLYREMAKE